MIEVSGCHCPSRYSVVETTPHLLVDLAGFADAGAASRDRISKVPC
jgi:hypothetical protein